MLPPKLSLGVSAAWAKLRVSSSLNHMLWVQCFAALSASAKSNLQLKAGYEGNEVILNCLQTSHDSALILTLTQLLALGSGYSLPDKDNHNKPVTRRSPGVRLSNRIQKRNWTGKTGRKGDRMQPPELYLPKLTQVHRTTPLNLETHSGTAVNKRAFCIIFVSERGKIILPFNLLDCKR